MSRHVDGLIATPSQKPFQAEYQPLLSDIGFLLMSEPGLRVHSVYVYGSIAEGRAIPEKSDLDLSLILFQPLSREESFLLETCKARFEAAYPFLTKVDFDVGSLQDLRSEKTALAWSYWLKHHCRCIAGEDLSTEIEPYRPSLRLALAVNGDYSAVLHRYLAEIKASKTRALTQRLLKEASRKAIRSTNILRTEHATDWPATLEDHVDRMGRLYPERREDMEMLLTCATSPQSAPDDFAARLERFVKWMDEARR
ncbi:putative nucleotidyltransferase [Rhizobium aquaticum]|uniref:Nucleotidyltransferase n=1 Tax=Rhizobium aquaticum TaxID=1549636 RepID=A0ABV2J019_9HYPH